MPRIKNDSPRVEKPKARVYTKDELERFDKSIQRFYEDYTIETGVEKGKIVKVLNYPKLSTAFGATSERGAVILGDNPIRQEVLENLMNQHGWWKNGKDWAENKRLEELNEMAKEISEDKNIAPDMQEVFDHF